MGTIARRDLAAAIVARTKCRKAEAELAVEAVFETISKGMVDRHEIRIEQFGVFKADFIPAHAARNPSDGSTITVDDKYKIKFRPSSVLSNRVVPA